jgi:hypothetical protein
VSLELGQHSSSPARGSPDCRASLWQTDLWEGRRQVLASEVDPHDHATNLLSREAVSVIKSHASSSDRPLFLYLAYTAPHDPLQVDEGGGVTMIMVVMLMMMIFMAKMMMAVLIVIMPYWKVLTTITRRPA